MCRKIGADSINQSMIKLRRLETEREKRLSSGSTAPTWNVCVEKGIRDDRKKSLAIFKESGTDFFTINELIKLRRLETEREKRLSSGSTAPTWNVCVEKGIRDGRNSISGFRKQRTREVRRRPSQ
jgi:hypothetical protein